MPRCIPKMEPKDAQAATLEGVEIAEGLLKQDRHDTRLLAMESLEKLSGSIENKGYAARMILSNKLISSTLLELVQTSPSPEEDSFEMSVIEKEHVSRMRRMSFIVLGNCLTTLAHDAQLCGLLKEHGHLASDSVVEAFSSELSAAGERPHEASQAAECLRVLMTASEDIAQRASTYRISESLVNAHGVGACRHLGLERACTKLRAQGLVD